MYSNPLLNNDNTFLFHLVFYLIFISSESNESFTMKVVGMPTETHQDYYGFQEPLSTLLVGAKGIVFVLVSLTYSSTI